MNCFQASRVAVAVIFATLVVAGCGSSNKSSGNGGQSSAEAKSAATGDIPDNQVFLTFRNPAAPYSIVYPEGWARRGGGADITLRDKQNVIHVVVARGPRPTPTSVRTELARLRRSDPSLSAGVPHTVKIRGRPVVKVTYRKRGPADPVTAKRLTLTIDRYVYARGGQRATLDLATPVGVDNVDAYRMISQSFRWK